MNSRPLQLQRLGGRLHRLIVRARTVAPAAGAQRGALAFAIGLIALVGLEAVNAGTTYAALQALTAGALGLTVGLTVALWALDFGGLLRIFGRVEERDPALVYFAGAWLTAAAVNALGTWYAVGLALSAGGFEGGAFVDQAALVEWAPIAIAAAVLLARVLFVAAWVVDAAPRQRPHVEAGND